MNNCPKCKSDWTGEEIPEKNRHYYGGATHYKRDILIDGGFLGIYDGAVAIKCPDCGEEFPRNGSHWAMEMFNKYKEVTGEKV